VIASVEDWRIIAALRRGEESAFASLIAKHQASLMRLARIFVKDPIVAEEVTQETWLGVLRGIANFEGRSSLKTWIFRILTNTAKTRAQREGRSVPFSSVWDADAESNEPAVNLDRFQPANAKWHGHWVSFPQNWGKLPEEWLLAEETISIARRAIEALPPSQREIITLRDVEGWTSDEVCNVLGISETNQRVLLHRARSKVRRVLEEYWTGE
jgi:RNA polymerase sigma-70 factor (ECF subfamily)